ncbi:MAG: two-component sensor histidine kinase, partial [Gallionella sp.]|nr:two-component sensor histidine kinase [Gallionella sp.]
NGAGLAQADIAKLTERFYRPVGTIGSGSGLGLSIVKSIAEIHHAELTVTPRKTGSGLSVSVSFKT